MSSGDGSGHILLMDFDKEYNETTLGVAMKGLRGSQCNLGSPNEMNIWQSKGIALKQLYMILCMIVKVTA
jgi:hypothetical protein